MQLVPLATFWEVALEGLWPCIEDDQGLSVLVVPCAMVRLPAAVQLHDDDTRDLLGASVVEAHLLLDVFCSRHPEQR